jgi:hypothetical protein
MKISAISIEPRPSGARLSARVSWEDSERPFRGVWIDIEGVQPQAVSARPEAFLPACALLAMRDGERRIAVSGPVCPRLRDGLAVAATILREWHGPPRRGATIEASEGFQAPRPAPAAREGLLFTGGVSSLHSLWRNHNEISSDHPSYYRDLLWVEGLSSPATASAAMREALGAHAAAADCRLIVGSTNLRTLAPDTLFYYREYFGALLSGFGHALSASLTALSFSSAWDLAFGVRVASHPLLDPFFESAALSVRHEDAEVPRLEKMKALRMWPEAWAHLVVCDFPPEGSLNCGHCEKCCRVRLQLEVAGLAGAARTLPAEVVSAEEISALSLDFLIDYFWEPLVAPLRGLGRSRAANAVEKRIAEARRRQEWINGQGARGKMRRFDRRYFGGALWNFARRTKRRSATPV